MNRVDRLTGTILLLQTRPGISLGDIAAHWEVSERTVFRDLAALAEMGVPVATGEGGGYRLLGSFSLPPILLNEDEAAAMAIAVAATEEIGDVSLRRALRSGLAKIQAVLPLERQAELKRWREVVEVWLAPGGPPSDEDVFRIRRAILAKNCIAFTYFTKGVEPGCERVAEPLGLLYYAGHWHLLAHCRLRDDFRDFRLDRMSRIMETGETFAGHEAFSIHTHLAQEMAKAEAAKAVEALYESP